MESKEVAMKSLFLLTIAATGMTAWAQTSGGSLRARELFYTPPPQAAAKPAAPAPTPAKPPAPALVKETAKKAVPQSAPQPTTTAVTPAAPVVTAPPPVSPSAPARPPAAPVTAAAPQQVPTRVVSNAPQEAIPLGMRYAVLRRNPAGKFVEIDPESTFHSGDRIRLEMQANSAGYLYVVAQGSSGNWQVLFPSREVAGGSNEVSRGEVRQIPAGDRGQFVFRSEEHTSELQSH